ncbi:MAG: hypothetical protein IT199_05560 [Solirubrobacterales bacterium]|nr:hypothetical protein [Solirubrobacterales bacterium]
MSQINKPTETIHLPAPSWAPAVFALGVLGLVAGTFANDFMFPAWFYAAVGLVFCIFSLRSMIKKGRRAFYALPREQEDARAELPVESFTAPSAD